MFSRPNTLRFALALVAFLSVIANGAQAHIGLAAPAQMAMPVCGMGPNMVVMVDVGEPAPTNSEGQSCCGECIAFAAIPPDSLQTASLYAPHRITRPAAPQFTYRPGAPLWPGAPPHGPPALS